MARDYESLRALLLDHLGRVVPGAERLPAASLEIALVEAMAYLGDYLSHYQDAVATEAYVQTARLRASLVRHASLLGVPVIGGCCARVPVQFITNGHGVRLPAGTQVVTGLGAGCDVQVSEAVAARAAVRFATLHPLDLHSSHNRMPLAFGHRPPQAWDCSATLEGRLSRLAPGMVLILQHAPSGWVWAVRLLAVKPGASATRIEWHPADALPETVPQGGDWQVLGNVALAEEGTVAALQQRVQWEAGADDLVVAMPPPAWTVPYPAAGGLTGALRPELRPDPGLAQPAIWLEEAWDGPSGKHWPARRWLAARATLGAAAAERFVPEQIDPEHLRLRFGRSPHRQRPDPDVPLRVVYRSSAGQRGNVPIGSLCHVVGAPAAVVGISNPLPARGGCDPEPLEALRTRLLEAAAWCPAGSRRLVTESDYADRLARFPGVAASTARITPAAQGRTVTLSVLRAGDAPFAADFAAALHAAVAPQALLGDQLSFVPAELVEPWLLLSTDGADPASQSDVCADFVAALCALGPVPTRCFTQRRLAAAVTRSLGVTHCRIAAIGASREELENRPSFKPGRSGFARVRADRIVWQADSKR